MTKPITIPNTFASATSAIPLSQLDQDFSALANATNDLATYSNYVADTGAADAYIANFPANTNTSSLTAGLTVQFKAANANTGASTLNVQVNGSTIGTAAIRYANGSSLAAGAIAAGALVSVMYDGTNFQLINDPAGQSGGDVTGPASATDNAIARFDGTSGKLIQNSVVTIADTTGDMSGVGTLSAGNVTVSGTANAATLIVTGNSTLGDASGDTLTITGTTVTTPNGLNFDSNTFVIDATNDRVGIGTSSPTVILDIVKTTNAVTIASISNLDTGSSARADFAVNSDSANGNFGATSSTNTAAALGGRASTVALLTGSVNSAGGIAILARNSAGYITLHTGGNTERMRISSTGDVGIGTSSPSYRLHVKSSSGVILSESTGDVTTTGTSFLSLSDSNGAAAYLGFGGDGAGVMALWNRKNGATIFATNNTERMRIDSSGRLLIGNTANNAAFGGKLQVEGTSDAFVSFVRYSSSAGGAPGLYLARSKSATLGTNTIVASGDTLGNILFSGANGTGYSDAASITAAVDGTPGASADMPGRLVFSTSADGSATPTERMRIDSSGNLGLGVTPLGSAAGAFTQLQIGGSSGRSTFYGQSNDFACGVISGAYFDSSNNTVYASSTKAISNLYLYDGTLRFSNAASGTSGNNATLTERMRINSSGNVGIGTSSPSCPLNVVSASSSLAIAINGRSSDSLGAMYFYANNGSTSYCQITSSATEFRVASQSTAVQTFYTNGSERMRIDSSGYVQINTTTADAVLSIHTDGTNTAKGYGVALVNDAGGGNTWTLQCGQYAVNNGTFTIYDKTNNKYAFNIESSTNYVTAKGIYDLTSGSAANVYVDSNGALYRSTSSLKYKTNIQNTSHGLAEVLQLRPVTYKGKNDGDKVFGGFIAEEVDKIGLKEFVEYADDGSPDSLAYGNMVSLLTKAIQEQQAMIEELKQEVALLKSK